MCVLCRFKTPESSQPPEERDAHGTPNTQKRRVGGNSLRINTQQPGGAAGGGEPDTGLPSPPAGGTGDAQPSRENSPGPVSLEQFLNAEIANLKWEDFFKQHAEYQVYNQHRYLRGIRRVAQCLSDHVSMNSDGKWFYFPHPRDEHFDNRFTRWARSQYLIRAYVTDLETNTQHQYFFKYHPITIELFVLLTIWSSPVNHFNNDTTHTGWFRYLQFVGGEYTIELEQQYQRERYPDERAETPLLAPPGARELSPGYAYTSPISFGIESKDMELSDFCKTNEKYDKYLAHLKGVEKVAEYLSSNVKKNEDGFYVYIASKDGLLNVSRRHDLQRSEYLISNYISALGKKYGDYDGSTFFDTQGTPARRQCFVVTAMERWIYDDDKHHREWLRYLNYFETDDMVSAQQQSQEDRNAQDPHDDNGPGGGGGGGGLSHDGHGNGPAGGEGGGGLSHDDDGNGPGGGGGAIRTEKANARLRFDPIHNVASEKRLLHMEQSKTRMKQEIVEIVERKEKRKLEEEAEKEEEEKRARTETDEEKQVRQQEIVDRTQKVADEIKVQFYDGNFFQPWKSYQDQVRTLTRYLILLSDAPSQLVSKDAYDKLTKEGEMVGLLEYWNGCQGDDDYMSYLKEKFPYQDLRSLQDEYIVVDSMNFDVKNARQSIDTFKTFLAKMPASTVSDEDLIAQRLKDVTIEQQRTQMYEKFKTMHERKPQIERLAKHIRAIIDKPWSKPERIEKNPNTKLILTYFRNHDEILQQIKRSYAPEVADEFMVLKAISYDLDRGNALWEDFAALLAQVDLKIQQDPNGAQLRNYNLGSDLHTSPADGGTHVLNNLTRRVQALQDW